MLEIIQILINLNDEELNSIPDEDVIKLLDQDLFHTLNILQQNK